MFPDDQDERETDRQSDPEAAAAKAAFDHVGEDSHDSAEAEAGEAETEPAAAHTPEAEPASSMNWYIVHTYSGFENKVAESLRTRAEAFGFSHRIGQILIPTEEVV